MLREREKLSPEEKRAAEAKCQTLVDDLPVSRKSKHAGTLCAPQVRRRCRSSRSLFSWGAALCWQLYTKAELEEALKEQQK